MTSPNNANSLDDIFGSSPPPETAHPAPTVEPSELPSLRRQHVTAGYRDGISTSKGEHVQEGFDAGFPVGAQLGMRAGTVLGILEGIVRGYESRASGGVIKKQPLRGAASKEKNDEGEEEAAAARRAKKREEVLKLYQAAVKEFSVQSVFGVLEEPAGGEKEKAEKAEIQLARKGDGAVSRWEERVSVARWEENMDVLEAKGEEKEEKREMS